jgi:hypothetical protein
MADAPGVFPWLILFRTFRIAISPTLLALATVAVLIAPLGWRFAERLFLSEVERDALIVTDSEIPQAANSQLRRSLPPAPRAYLPAYPTALLESYFDLAEPLKRFFQLQITWGEAAYYAFGFLWTLAIWAFPGGVATRQAVVQLATDSTLGIRSTLLYVARRWRWYFLAPLAPLLGIVLLAFGIIVLGWLHAGLNWLTRDSGVSGLGTAVTGLAWLFVALAGLVALWLFGGLIFGWPLMWPTISAERDGDVFEAFSRSYSYVYGKPLHYFFYVVVAAAFGALCWSVVTGAALIVQEFGFWALAWGAGADAIAEIRQQALRIAAGEAISSEHGGLWKFGITLIGLVLVLIHAVAAAFRFTFFFAVTSAIYLLLRQDVDEKEMDEVYLERDEAIASTPKAEAPAAALATDSVAGRANEE